MPHRSAQTAPRSAMRRSARRRRGESVPPGAVPPRPSRNDSENPSRLTLPKARQHAPIYLNANQAKRLVQLSLPQRDPDRQPPPASRAQRSESTTSAAGGRSASAGERMLSQAWGGEIRP